MLLRALVLACLCAAPASARDLVMGSASEPSSLDPLFSRTGNNQNVAAQIFDRLVTPDANLRLQPTLALSWTNLDPLTWRIELRPGVVFQDGNPLTPDDVIFSFERARSIANSPAPFTAQVSAIQSVVAIGATTLEIRTKAPTPDLMDQIGLVYIVEKKLALGQGAEAFTSGRAMVGTGPFRFVSFVPGDRLQLVRNERYWGTPPAFEHVTIRTITNPAARVAALRAGEVDLINAVPSVEVKLLEATPGLHVFSVPSTRVAYLALDSMRQTSPFVTDLQGRPLTPNPLTKPAVREAISHMINRKGIVDRLLDGAALPAGQLVPEGVGGYDPALVPPPYEPKVAREMLARAGYPNGFGLTLHSSTDRYAGEGQVALALGQMLTQGGIRVAGVVTQPYNVYASAAGRGAFSAFTFTLATISPTSATTLRNLLMTPDRKNGVGGFNRVGYSNPAFDREMVDAMATFDPAERERKLAAATATVMHDDAVIPLFWLNASWAAREGITYEANKSEDFQANYAGVAP